MKRTSPEPVAVLRGHVAPINTTCFLNTSLILSGAGDGTIKTWNTETRREVVSIAAHSRAGVLQTQRFGTSKFLTHGRDGFIKLWDLDTFSLDASPVAEWYCGSYTFTKASGLRWDIESENHMIICPSESSEKIAIFDTRSTSNQPSLTVAAPKDDKKRGMCMSLGLFTAQCNSDISTSRQTYIAVGYESGALSIFDLRSGGKHACEAQITPEPNALLAFDVSASGNKFMCGSSDGKLIHASFDPTLLSINSKTIFECNTGGISDIKFRPDQRIFVVAGWDRRVRVFHTRKLKPLAFLKYHTDSVFGVDFSGSNELLVSASKDRKLALWSIYQQKAIDSK